MYDAPPGDVTETGHMETGGRMTTGISQPRPGRVWRAGLPARLGRDGRAGVHATVVAVAVVAAVALTGCGGAARPGASSSPFSSEAAQSVTPTGTPRPAPSATPSRMGSRTPASGDESSARPSSSASSTHNASTTGQASTPTRTTQARSSSPSTTDWSEVIPGVWTAKTSGDLGEELWTFNGRTNGAVWQFWPQGVGVSNPLNNGRAAPAHVGNVYSVRGTTLTVSTPLGSTRVYSGLTSVSRTCFSARFKDRRVLFCRYTG